jgi:hypothetical protein
MTDDWSPPTGEYERAYLETASADPSGPTPLPDEEIDPVFGVTESELRMADAFFFEAALASAREPRPSTPEELEAVADLRAQADRLKTMTPEELEAERQRLMRTGG